MAKSKRESFITEEIIAEYNLLYPMLTSVFEELKELSKKKQDGLLNQMKVKLTNKILVKIKTLLKDEPTSEFLDLLDEESIPSNSDAVLMLAQFNSALEQFKSKNTIRRGGYTYWNTENNSKR